MWELVLGTRSDVLVDPRFAHSIVPRPPLRRGDGQELKEHGSSDRLRGLPMIDRHLVTTFHPSTGVVASMTCAVTSWRKEGALEGLAHVPTLTTDNFVCAGYRIHAL